MLDICLHVRGPLGVQFRRVLIFRFLFEKLWSILFAHCVLDSRQRLGVIVMQLLLFIWTVHFDNTGTGYY